MNLSRRTRGLGIAASVTAAALALGLATSAHAVTPNWPTAGYHPTCDLSSPTTGGPTGYEYQYLDKTAPSIVSYTHPKYQVIKNPGTVVTFGTLRVKDSCSGVQVSVGVWTRGVANTSAVAYPTGTAYFDSTMTMKSSGPIPIAYVGAWKFLWAESVDRWDSFYLSSDFKTVGASPVASSHTPATSEKWAGQTTYLVRDTTMGAVANHLTIAKGGRVYINGTLKVANGTTYAALGTTRVYLQRLYAGGKWTTVGDGVTSASGAIKLSYKPTKTARFRLVYTGRFASPWNAPRTTGTVKVTVK